MLTTERTIQEHKINKTYFILLGLLLTTALSSLIVSRLVLNIFLRYSLLASQGPEATGKGLANFCGVISFILSVILCSLALIRSSLSKIRFTPHSLINCLKRKLLLFLRILHQPFGWTVAILALVHSIFFLLYYFDPHAERHYVIGTFSGTIAALAFTWVLVTGFRYKVKSRLPILGSRRHLLLSALTVILVIIHVISLRFKV